MSTASTQDQKILEHLRRATELDVSLSDYADAYEVDLTALSEAQARRVGEDTRNDFVRVTITDDATVAGQVLCRLVHADGWSLECQAWPPAAWLRSLAEVRS